MATKNHIAVSKHPLYRAWCGMRRRCDNPKDTVFKSYGGRGITVCERWMSFANFVADMGERPAGCSLDRRDNSKGYSPDNCRWATPTEQNRNKRNNVLVTVAGQVVPLSEACEIGGAGYFAAYARITKLGWTPEQAIIKSDKEERPYRQSSQEGYRVCFRCDREMLATSANFIRDKTRLDGIAYECKPCHRKRRRGRDRSKELYENLTPERKALAAARQARYQEKKRAHALLTESPNCT